MKHSAPESHIRPILITTDLWWLHPQTDSVSGVFLAVMDFWQFTGSFWHGTLLLYILEMNSIQGSLHERGPLLLVPDPHHPLSGVWGGLHTSNKGETGVEVLLPKCVSVLGRVRILLIYQKIESWILVSAPPSGWLSWTNWTREWQPKLPERLSKILISQLYRPQQLQVMLACCLKSVCVYACKYFRSYVWVWPDEWEFKWNFQHQPWPGHVWWCGGEIKRFQVI